MSCDLISYVDDFVTQQQQTQQLCREVDMAARQFIWTWPKAVVVISHLADQQRFNSAFSGQNPDDAYNRDLDYYNGLSQFSDMEVTKRQLHGKDSIYTRIYGLADSLLSQLMKNGRDVAINLLDYKAFGISTASMLRGGEWSSYKQQKLWYLIR